MKKLVWWLSSPLLALLVLASPVEGVEGVEGPEQPETTAPDKTASEKTYAIQLYRGTRVGEQFHMTAKATLTNTETLFDGEESLGDQSESGQIHFEANGRILAVDEDGGVTQAEYDVISYETIVNGQPGVGLSAGQVIETKSVGSETQIMLRDGELTPSQSFFLAQILETANPEDTRDDVIFGISDPQTLGAHWEINKGNAVEELGKNLVLVDEESLVGTTHLVAIREIDGTPCMYLEGSLEASPFASVVVPTQDQISSRLAISFSGCYPLDLDRVAVRGHISSYTSVRNQIGAEDGVPVILRKVSESEKDFSLRPLAEAPKEAPTP